MMLALGAYPDDPYFDPNRPSWLPYWIDSLTESQRKVEYYSGEATAAYHRATSAAPIIVDFAPVPVIEPTGGVPEIPTWMQAEIDAALNVPPPPAPPCDFGCWLNKNKIGVGAAAAALLVIGFLPKGGGKH